MKTFALIGAAGYVAPRHMEAIKSVGGELVAALDPHDSVGILDRYFPECQFFTEFERFDRHIDMLRYNGAPVDYAVVASPNWLHDVHSRWAMRNGMDVICEKPLACNVRNLDLMAETEKETGRRVWNILQCRLHPEAISARNEVRPDSAFKQVWVEYYTPRGDWFSHSWKGEIAKSGGIATNIGIHLFDLCAWLLGPMDTIEVFGHGKHDIGGKLENNRAQVLWRLSVDTKEEPKRFFALGGIEINLTNGFENLHTLSYQEILAGRGFGIEDAREGVRIAEEIRNAC